jgi:hypothetical protein
MSTDPTDDGASPDTPQDRFERLRELVEATERRLAEAQQLHDEASRLLRDAAEALDRADGLR